MEEHAGCRRMRLCARAQRTRMMISGCARARQIDLDLDLNYENHDEPVRDKNKVMEQKKLSDRSTGCRCAGNFYHFRQCSQCTQSSSSSTLLALLALPALGSR